MKRNCHPMILTVVLALFATLSAFAASTRYGYDEAGRLTNAAYSGGANIAYAYDANGNLLVRETTAGGATTYTLIYRAGAGGWIGGVATQEVAAGGSGSVVTAALENASVVFAQWSDGRADQTRTDTNVQANVTVQAAFHSVGGSELDWYAARGISPGGGEDWTDVDGRIAAGKGTTLLHENIADTDPTVTSDLFRVIGIEPGPPVIVHFQPGSTGRVYTFQFADDLNDGTWTNVSGTSPRPGVGGADSMIDTNRSSFRSHRIQVELP